MRVIIWGTGWLAQNLCHDGINAEIIGFVETIRTKNIFYGYKVYTPDTIPEIYDYIIVANTFSNEIYKECLKYKIDISKVIFLKRANNVLFNDDKNISIILGEKNYAAYASEYKEWKNTFVEKDMIEYSKMNTRQEFAIQEKYLIPCISEKYAKNSGMSAYFWQDLWAAKHIIGDGVKEHFDIGSRVDGFIAHLLAANIKVNMIDVRPFPGEAENLYTIVDDATMMKQFEDNSISSLSAMCSFEHLVDTEIQ